jgi:hypothetical protein
MAVRQHAILQLDCEGVVSVCSSSLSSQLPWLPLPTDFQRNYLRNVQPNKQLCVKKLCSFCRTNKVCNYDLKNQEYFIQLICNKC